MSSVQGLHTRVNLKNGDVFYGIATQVDDDGSISLEQGKPTDKRWPWTHTILPFSLDY
jgi:hypothetical protein